MLSAAAKCADHAPCPGPQKLKSDLESKKSEQDADADGVDEVDAAVLNCNIAVGAPLPPPRAARALTRKVRWYQVVAMSLRKYATASATLERLFRTIEPLEELLVGSYAPPTPCPVLR
eukprot:1253761-Rhodomonas_salina.2